METTTIMNSATIQESFIGPNEDDLVSLAQKGDLESFNQIVLLWQDKIYALALRILGDEDSAEDITQNTFLAAYSSLPGFRNGSLRSWLYRIVTNACYDEFRRRKRHPALPLEYKDDAEEGLVPLQDLPDSGMLPE